MFVSSMSSEQKKAEALKDFGLMKTKIDMAYDSFLKQLRQKAIISPIKRITITTKNKNTWTITFVVMLNGISLQIYTPVHNQKRNGYIAVVGTKTPLVLEYTAHFLQRYDERYLTPNSIKTGRYTLLEYFQLYNQNSTFTKTEKGYYMISNHGYMVGLVPFDGMMVHLTFIGNENLTNVKSTIYSKKMCELHAAEELLKYPKEITAEVLSKIAHKHNVGQEFIENWERWYS